VIMNSYDYESKLFDLLSSSTYKTLAKNTINTITNIVTKAIKYSSLDPTIQKHLIPHNPQTPRIYEQPKFHKKYISLGPILSAIGAPTYSIARFLVDKLQAFIKPPLLLKIPWISFIKPGIFTDEDLMVKFEVVSLFKKIPISKALTLIFNLVDPKTLNLIKICLSSTFFTFKGFFYEKAKGATMGSSLSPVVANTFIEHFKSLSLSNLHLNLGFFLQSS
jgi:hypothetical protein